MEEEIIPFQVKMGMVILGSFVGEEDQSVYVWIRRFENEGERKRLYDAVYQSDYWKNEISPRVPTHDRPRADQGHAPRRDAPLGHPVARGWASRADTLRDRVAIVTGASQGIGRAIAVELARVGAHVVVVQPPPGGAGAGGGRRARGGPPRAGRRVRRRRRRARWTTSSRSTLDAFGRIDLLVNNAGYRIRSPLEDLPRHEWDAMVGTNLTGVFLFSQAVGRVMIRQGAGKIVNVTSVAGRNGVRGMAAYAAAKAGVTVLTQSLGAEWAKYGITVNAVAPGPVETEGVLEVWKTPAMIAQAAREVPLGRLGRPEEIAWAVVFVASDQANFMTGETLYVSGGPRVGNREDQPGVTTAP